jgi:transposase
MNNNYQKRYTREFKEEAVRLLLTSGKSVKVLARELGTSHVSLLTWKEEALHNGDCPNGAQPGGVRVNYAVLEQENLRLKKEVETLRQQREILKKSLGILSQEPLREGML